MFYDRKSTRLICYMSSLAPMLCINLGCNTWPATGVDSGFPCRAKAVSRFPFIWLLILSVSIIVQSTGIWRNQVRKNIGSYCRIQTIYNTLHSFQMNLWCEQSAILSNSTEERSGNQINLFLLYGKGYPDLQTTYEP
jgi:hypothetical protein